MEAIFDDEEIEDLEAVEPEAENREEGQVRNQRRTYVEIDKDLLKTQRPQWVGFYPADTQEELSSQYPAYSFQIHKWAGDPALIPPFEVFEKTFGAFQFKTPEGALNWYKSQLAHWNGTEYWVTDPEAFSEKKMREARTEAQRSLPQYRKSYEEYTSQIKARGYDEEKIFFSAQPSVNLPLVLTHYQRVVYTLIAIEQSGVLRAEQMDLFAA